MGNNITAIRFAACHTSITDKVSRIVGSGTLWRDTVGKARFATECFTAFCILCRNSIQTDPQHLCGAVTELV